MSGSRLHPIDLTLGDEGDVAEIPFSCDDSRPPPVDGESTFRVERVVCMTRTGAGMWYLIKWFGYPAEEASWVHEADADGCREAVADFRKQQTREA
jgi:Chromo (CHRromatin Organisation MOdifier) domain